ncbi:MAG: histidine--tRNA ligase [Patescibacteria group bacterium]
MTTSKKKIDDEEEDDDLDLRPKIKVKLPGANRGKQIKSLRGMRDILPEEQIYWDFVTQKAEESLKFYGFAKIDTPILEDLNLFVRGVGEDTDIVGKEVFSFVDKGGEKVCLRPESTASVVRSYIEHGMINQAQPVKLYYQGPQFRHEKPQSGRFRQFYQLGLEVIGDPDPIIDAQLILFARNFLNELKLKFSIQVNSLGCKDCRKAYYKALNDFYRPKKRFLCKDCQKRMLKNPLRLLDCKEEECQKIAEEVPQIVDYLCEDCNKHFVKVLEYLDELEISYELNSKVVRGLDYYTKTIFEIWPISDDETKKISNGALGGGGRYDGLVEELGGQPTPACGMAFGIERIISQLKEQEIVFPQAKGVDIFLVQVGAAARKRCLSLFEELRINKIKVAESLSKNGLRPQLDKANKLKAKYSLILGQQELLDGTIIIRDMEDGTQETVNIDKVLDYVKKKTRTSKIKKTKLKK